MRLSDFRQVFFGFLIAAPAVLTAWGIGRYGVDIPLYDEWYEAPLLIKFHENALAWSDLWMPYNGHQLFFSRLTWLYLSRLTGWNTVAECWLSWGLGLVIFWLIARWLEHSPVRERPVFYPATLFLCSLLIFSFNQQPRWLHGFHMQFPLSIAAALGGFTLLLPRDFEWKRLVLAAALGVVATFSFSAGLAFWPSAFMLLCASTYKNRQDLFRATGVWILISILSASLFLVNIESASLNTYTTKEWARLLPGIGVFLASALTLNMDVSRWIGAAGFIYLTLMTVRIFKQIDSDRFRLCFVALGWFVVINALFVWMARASLGLANFASQRYAPVYNLFWVGVLGMTVPFGVKSDSVSQATHKKILAGLCFLMLVFAVVLLRIEKMCWANHKYLSGYLQQVQTQILAGDLSDETLHKVHPEASFVRQVIPDLQKHRLSLFHE